MHSHSSDREFLSLLVLFNICKTSSKVAILFTDVGNLCLFFTRGFISFIDIFNPVFVFIKFLYFCFSFVSILIFNISSASLLFFLFFFY